MKVAYVNNSDFSGGAARGAYRLHRALIGAGITSRLFVRNKILTDSTVLVPGTDLSNSVYHLKNYLSKKILRLQGVRTFGLRNLNLFSSPIVSAVKEFNPDIVQLHWIGSESLGISDFRRFKCPIVWRLADMWAFNATEHYTPDGPSARFRAGFTKGSRDNGERGFDIDRLVWKLKELAWRDLNISVVTGSRWLADCAKSSPLFESNRVEVIPSGIDTKVFRPLDKLFARDIYSIPKDVKVILFSAQNALKDYRKGFHFLYRGLKHFLRANKDVVLVVLGDKGDGLQPEFDFPVIHLGQLWDDYSLALAYSAADVCVAPSTQDNLPFTVMESIACGVPVVAFKVGGMPEMISHQSSGYLAEPFSSEDLISGVEWVLGSSNYQQLSENARNYALKHYSLTNQVCAYESLYRGLIADFSK